MMMRSDLKTIAGVSFDDILNESYDLLTKRKWDVRESGIGHEMDVWLGSKENKIKEMIKNPYYNGNLQIVIPAQIVRECCSNEATRFLKSIINSINLNEDFTTYHGKTANEILYELVENSAETVSIDIIKENSLADAVQSLKNNFNSDLLNKNKIEIARKMRNALETFYYDSFYERVNESQAERINRCLGLDKKKVQPGQKTSKVIHRILCLGGHYDKYNQAFTQLSDLSNGNVLKGYYVISLNFLDYLRMSDGHTWSSCHTTDPKNTRGIEGNYEGQYCQGCLSYANDDVTYITYFVGRGADTKHPDRSDKIYRQCMHLRSDNKMLVNGRIYPQGNDGQTDIYKIMNENFFNTMSLSLKKIGISKENAFITTDGANYKDYYYNRQCMLYSSEDNEDYSMTIGHTALSLLDGYELDKIYAHSTIV